MEVNGSIIFDLAFEKVLIVHPNVEVVFMKHVIVGDLPIARSGALLANRLD